MFNDEKLVAAVVSMLLFLLWLAIHFGSWIDAWI
jgi:hypothetical protein